MYRTYRGNISRHRRAAARVSGIMRKLPIQRLTYLLVAVKISEGANEPICHRSNRDQNGRVDNRGSKTRIAHT